MSTPPMTKNTLSKLAKLALGSVGVAFLSACGLNYSAPLKPPPGFIFTSIKAPLDHSFSKNNVTDAKDLKTGVSESQYIMIPLFFNPSIAFGDADVKKAANAGGISNLQYADYEIFNVLGIYIKTTVIARGK